MSRGSGEWQDTGVGADEVRDGLPVTCNVEGRMVLVLRQGADLFATDAVCPHKFAMLTDGAIGDGCITCPQHEATFDLTTGDAGDDRSWAGRLAVHDARFMDGRLDVRLGTSEWA